MKILRKNKFGMILAEALISVTILATGSIIVGNVIHSTVTSTISAKNYMIAQNLATEGAEAVKNIRDTNWLMVPDDEKCWLRMNPVEGEPCAAKVSDGGVYIAKQEGGKWMLTSSGTSSSGSSVALVSELDLGNSTSQEGDTVRAYQLYIDSSSGQYTYNQSGANKPSPFYRGLKFTTIDDDKAIFRVRVQWFEGVAARKLERTEIIYNSL